MKREAILSCEAWGRSMDASNIACSKVRALRTTVLAQQTEILDLRAAARAQQHSLWETLRMMVQQTQVTAIVGTAREPARGLAQMRLLKERPVLKEMIDQGVTDALAARDAEKTRMAMTTIIQEQVLEGQNKLLESVLTQTS
ncbi:hypothetical protein Tco_0107937 [Tanacetum coccineum]